MKLHLLFAIVFIGAAATAGIDLWAILRQRMLAAAGPDFRLLGRWLAHMRHGRFVHRPIAASAPVRGERTIGWTAHYLIGISFAALLPLACGPGWLRAPTLLPALLVGIGTVSAPFLILQPAMGAGFAASRTPRPAAARLQSIVTHTIFGLGLYASASLSSRLF